MTLKINGVPVPAEGLFFVFDGCHKIYLIDNEAGRRNLLRHGWSQSDFRHPSELPEVWWKTCWLRFINWADLREPGPVPQGEDALVEWS